jgi:hypothetical protein
MADEPPRFTLAELRLAGIQTGDWLVPGDDAAYRATVHDWGIELHDDMARISHYYGFYYYNDADKTFRWVRVHDVLTSKSLLVEGHTYRTRKAAWLAEGRAGQWVLVKGEEVAGFWPTWKQALEAGYERYGLGEFLVRQVNKVEPVVHL